MKVIEMVAEWKRLLVVLVAVFLISVFDIISIAFMPVVAVFLTGMIFKSDIVQEFKYCKMSDVINAEVHDFVLQYYDKIRWEMVFAWMIIVSLIRVGDIFGYLLFNAEMATILLMIGLVSIFFIEIKSYYSFLMKKNNVVRYENIEQEMITAICCTKTFLFLIIIVSAIAMFAYNGLADPLYSGIVCILIIPVVYCMYKLEYVAKIEEVSSIIY